jgi:nucleoside-diphosphate kinase
MKDKEITLTIIKPYAFDHREKIFTLIRKAGFDIIQISEASTRSKAEWEAFYAEHKGKIFFDNLVNFMCSGPIIAAILEKENAIQDFRTLIGSTNPANAEKGTIRNLYGNPNMYAQGKPANAIHGSDSTENAQKEIEFLFPGFQVKA